MASLQNTEYNSFESTNAIAIDVFGTIAVSIAIVKGISQQLLLLLMRRESQFLLFFVF